ncbi:MULTISPECIES: carboxymuconolactone decarboxylase family protein [Nocardia]|uniref:carboxymuconolactone decarboxylase family protein n=1 Tax=Nocardia TaxID=1817 RepID=UPI001892E55C|nr:MULTISPECIES: carboxymuconolactone decarboxylase family protein [Nocardia]MBF6352276.1 carboxymuconolactone decarboxylase family protein [Nocardia flavorosea]
MRVPPLPADRWDEDVDDALRVMLPRRLRNPDSASNALSTLVRHPALTKAFLTLNVHLLFRSPLPARLREIAILRVAHLRDCIYEWNHHREAALGEGITADEIAGIARGEAADPVDRLILRAVDELDEKSNLSDATWDGLCAHLDEQQRMDLIFTIGTYNMLAAAFNTFGIRSEYER